jgi:hypothetical protein
MVTSYDLEVELQHKALAVGGAGLKRLADYLAEKVHAR